MLSLGLLILPVFISLADGYSLCPNVECAPGCVKIDPRGCKCCACGVAMFNHFCEYGMFGMPGGAGFVPGSLSGGGSFGSIQGAAPHHEKSVKECPGTMLCMMTCKGKYTLGKTGNDGCKSCTCPAQHHVTQQHVNTHVEYVQAVRPVAHHETHQASCTGTKLCMMTCHGRHVLGPKGSDGCSTCTCIPEATPAPTPAPAKSCMATVLCMLSCKTGYSMGKTGSDGCQSCTCINPPTAAPTTPAPKPLECVKTIECMLSCKSGYELGNTGPDGCPQCRCIQPKVVVQPVIIEKLTCPSKLSCNTGCGAGYKCGDDGCPVCECIKPAVVGLKVVEIIQKPVACSTALSCPKSCTLGYKCGPDGCPTCECLVAIQTESCHECENNNHISSSNIVNHASQGQQQPMPSISTGILNQVNQQTTATTHCNECENNNNNQNQQIGNANSHSTLTGQRPLQTQSGFLSNPFNSGQQQPGIQSQVPSAGANPNKPNGFGSTNSAFKPHTPYTSGSQTSGMPSFSSGFGSQTQNGIGSINMGSHVPAQSKPGSKPSGLPSFSPGHGSPSQNGFGSTNSGSNPHASGFGSTNSGSNPHASGFGSTNSGSNPHASGSHSNGMPPFLSGNQGNAGYQQGTNMHGQSNGFSSGSTSGNSGSNGNTGSTLSQSVGNGKSPFNVDQTGTSLLNTNAKPNSNNFKPSLGSIANKTDFTPSSGNQAINNSFRPKFGNQATTNTSGTGPFVAGGLGPFTNEGFHPLPFSQAAGNSSGKGPFSVASGNVQINGTHGGPFSGLTQTNTVSGQTNNNPNGPFYNFVDSQQTGTKYTNGLPGLLGSSNQTSGTQMQGQSSGPFNIVGGSQNYGGKENENGSGSNGYPMQMGSGSQVSSPFVSNGNSIQAGSTNSNHAGGNSFLGSGNFSPSRPGKGSSFGGNSFVNAGTSTHIGGGMTSAGNNPFSNLKQPGSASNSSGKNPFFGNNGVSGGNPFATGTKPMQPGSSGSNGFGPSGGSSVSGNPMSHAPAGFGGQHPGGALPMSGGQTAANGGTNGQVSIVDLLKKCPESMHCMTTCPLGYQLGGEDKEGCPKCTCLGSTGEVMKGLPHQSNLGRTRQESLEHVEQSPAQNTENLQLNCPASFSCPIKCDWGYKRSGDGCPSCDCVGQKYSNNPEPIDCEGDFICSKDCKTGYRAANDGCPDCSCVEEVVAKPQPKPMIVVAKPQPKTTPNPVIGILQKCPSTMKCMDSCQYGYTLGSAGRDGCPSCTCEKQCHTCQTHTAVAVKTCDALANCMVTCENGYTEGAKDASGCATCKCVNVCHECEAAKPQIVQVVATQTQTEHCNECENHSSGGQAVALVSSGGSSSGSGSMTGGGSGGGGMTGGLAGGSAGGMAGGMSSGGSGGGTDCKPLPPNCHPYCIKYDVAHCRLCTCESSQSLGGGFNGK